MIDIGKFDRKGVIQRRSLTANSIGEDIQSYADYKAAWAQIVPVSAREKLNGAQIDSDVTHILRFRLITDLTANDRFVYNGRVFNFAGTPINYREGNYMTEVHAVEAAQ